MKSFAKSLIIIGMALSMGLAAAGPSLWADDYDYGYDWSEVADKIEDLKSAVPNGALLIYKAGDMRYENYYGTGYNSSTVKKVGSAIKWPTTTLVMDMVEAGYLSLDDYVATYIDDFDTTTLGGITVRHCLSCKN